MASLHLNQLLSSPKKGLRCAQDDRRLARLPAIPQQRRQGGSLGFEGQGALVGQVPVGQDVGGQGRGHGSQPGVYVHQKLNHDGQLVGLLDPPRGRGLDGVWRNATPPPEYLITETKFTTAPGAIPSLSKNQMSDIWVGRGKRLSRAVGEKEAKRVRRAMLTGQAGKQVLHIDSAGNLTQYEVDAIGKMSLLK